MFVESEAAQPSLSAIRLTAPPYQMLPLFCILQVALGQTASMRRGAVSFAAPTSWHLIDQPSTSEAFVYHIPSPHDSATNERTNLLVIVHVRHDRASLREFSDSMWHGMLHGEVPFPADDVTHGQCSRSIFWRGHSGNTPYVLLDKFAVKDSFYLTFRFAMPLLDGTPPEWEERTIRDVNALVASLAINRDHVFRAHDPLTVGPLAH